MRTVIVIPARYASSRLLGKPLLRLSGKYLIQHVHERAVQAKCADRVIVATDDPRIEAAVKGFGGEVAMTRRDHPSGTDRVAEAVQRVDADCVINLQGDEPEIDPVAIDSLAALLQRDPHAGVATLAVPIRTPELWHNPNCVKVVFDNKGRALYFSRAPIPACRDGEPDFYANPPRIYQHVGIYAYRRASLLAIAATPPASIEQMEKLEQLRAMAMGISIHVGVVAHAARGIDTPTDYAAFLERRRVVHAQAA